MAIVGSIRALLEAGVFQAILTGGESISATEISAKTGVDKEIIGARDSCLMGAGRGVTCADRRQCD
jgi:hypothetical protein